MGWSIAIARAATERCVRPVIDPLDQLVGVDRLGQVRLEARLGGAELVFRPRVGRQRD